MNVRGLVGGVALLGLAAVGASCSGGSVDALTGPGNSPRRTRFGYLMTDTASVSQAITHLHYHPTDTVKVRCAMAHAVSAKHAAEACGLRVVCRDGAVYVSHTPSNLRVLLLARCIHWVDYLAAMDADSHYCPKLCGLILAAPSRTINDRTRAHADQAVSCIGTTRLPTSITPPDEPVDTSVTWTLDNVVLWAVEPCAQLCYSEGEDVDPRLGELLVDLHNSNLLGPEAADAVEVALIELWESRTVRERVEDDIGALSSPTKTLMLREAGQ
jgi:hypothetical protein